MTKEKCCSEKDYSAVKPMNNVECCSSEGDSCCESSITNDVSAACCTPDDEQNCDCNTETVVSQKQTKSENEEFEIEIDSKSVTVTDSSMNIVDIAKAAGITIPAPCYFAKRKQGCCKACVVEIDKKQAYACGTKPSEGMNIVVNRADLKELRKERMLKYKEAIKNNEPLKCDGIKE
ncbi:MAG: hypothetical protein N4A74_13500 [Carboxylicivirga sp.]|jgi:hypothetical protein|nr:hypothetical protein [Carboxylicivirga sp.]